MSDVEDMGATNVRVTFRTFKAYVAKLRAVAKAHNLRIGKRLSIGAALNMIIDKYDEKTDRAKAKKRGTK